MSHSFYIHVTFMSHSNEIIQFQVMFSTQRNKEKYEKIFERSYYFSYISKY